MLLADRLQPLNLDAKELFLPFHRPFDRCPVVIKKKEGVTW